MTLVDEKLDPDFDVDERVFHYTSPEGLYGILTEGCLWATHFRFLNDSNEFTAARESLIEFVRRELHKRFAAWKVNRQLDFEKGEDLRGLAAHDAETIIDAMYDTTYNRMGNAFVFSGFCCSPRHDAYRNGGLLNWAIYGQKGGYAIKFNPHKLGELLKIESSKFSMPMWRSSKVIYSTTEPSDELKSDYEIIAEVAKEMVTGSVTNSMEEVDIGRTAVPFSRVSSLLKDAYFRDEAEARIVLVRPHEKSGDMDPHVLRMRQKNGVTIPYVELFRDILFGEHSPVEAILIGPHTDRTRRQLALEVFLKSRGLSSIEVIESEVPYVG